MLNHYRVEAGTNDTGLVRPGDEFHHEFDAPDDDQAVRVAAAYALSQHGTDARSRVYQQLFLGWVRVAVLVGERQVPMNDFDPSGKTYAEYLKRDQ